MAKQTTQVLRGSNIFLGCCEKQNDLIGFARVLTDYTFKAMIFDVIVAEEERGNRVGEALVDKILNHQELKDVESFELYCPDRLVPFYQKQGFEINSSKLLQLKRS